MTMAIGGQMSGLNGDKARFQKNRKRKVLHRQQVRAVVAGLAADALARGVTAAAEPADAASLAMSNEGGATRTAD
jgi:hypothetical protein